MGYLYLTEVDLDVEGDVFFPEVKSEEWDLVSSEHHSSDEKNEYNYTFKVWNVLNPGNCCFV